MIGIRQLTLIAMILAASSLRAQTRKIFIEQKVGTTANGHCISGDCTARGGTVDFSLVATDALLKGCPDIISITTDPVSADFSLRLQTGASALIDKSGNVVFVSHARHKLKNFAKDICGYVRTAPATAAH
jgi:hypothetical protein